MNQKRSYFCAVAILGALSSTTVGATAPQRAPAAWETGTLATTGDVGMYCHARLDGAGDLHVVYLRQDTGEIRVLSRVGGTWQPPEVVDPAGSAASDCSISAVGAGERRCAWRRGDTYTLMYAGPETVHIWEIGGVTSGADDIGRELSLLRRSTGEASVACRNTTDESLVFMTRDVSGVWSLPEVIDPGPDRGAYVDHAYRTGNGYMFSQRDEAESALLYADSALAVNRWEIGTVTSGADDVGGYLSIHRRETGEVSVACRNETKDALVFATRDALGAWSAPDTIDAGPNRGTYCDVTYRPGGGYAFSERDDQTYTLLYADQELRSHNWKIGAVRTRGDAGRYVSATRMPDGHVACSFYRFDTGTKGSLEIAYNVGSADFWVVRSVADSIATAAPISVDNDLVITSGWEGFVSFRDDLTAHLYYAYNDSITTGVGEDPSPWGRPLAFGLRPNYPNPFNPQTTILYTIRETGPVRLAVYDVSGGLVRTLVDEPRPAGEHKTTWDGRNDRGQQAASGVYFLRLSSAGHHRAQKLVLVK